MRTNALRHLGQRDGLQGYCGGQHPPCGRAVAVALAQRGCGRARSTSVSSKKCGISRFERATSSPVAACRRALASLWAVGGSNVGPGQPAGQARHWWSWPALLAVGDESGNRAAGAGACRSARRPGGGAGGGVSPPGRFAWSGGPAGDDARVVTCRRAAQRAARGSGPAAGGAGVPVGPKEGHDRGDGRLHRAGGPALRRAAAAGRPGGDRGGR